MGKNAQPDERTPDYQRATVAFIDLQIAHLDAQRKQLEAARGILLGIGDIPAERTAADYVRAYPELRAAFPAGHELGEPLKRDLHPTPPDNEYGAYVGWPTGVRVERGARHETRFRLIKHMQRPGYTPMQLGLLAAAVNVSPRLVGNVLRAGSNTFWTDGEHSVAVWSLAATYDPVLEPAVATGT